MGLQLKGAPVSTGRLQLQLLASSSGSRMIFSFSLDRLTGTHELRQARQQAKGSKELLQLMHAALMHTQPVP